jgi:hypothetical protein
MPSSTLSDQIYQDVEKGAYSEAAQKALNLTNDNLGYPLGMVYDILTNLRGDAAENRDVKYLIDLMKGFGYPVESQGMHKPIRQHPRHGGPSSMRFILDDATVGSKVKPASQVSDDWEDNSMFRSSITSMDI